MIRRQINALCGAALAVALCCLAAAAPPPSVGITYDTQFWQHWSDGRAEVSGYELTIPRYGELRSGTAVAIFVTETLSRNERVKVEQPDRNNSDHFPVMKLNLVKDFATGIYDYNLMTSVFVALEPINGRPAGSPTKVSFSSQEWCGHVYHQLIYEQHKIRQQIHSYFENEADVDNTLTYPADGVSEDALLLWARGLAGPTVKPGQSIKAPLLTSLQQARLNHVQLDWHTATFGRAERTHSTTVPAGTCDTRRCTVQVDGEVLWEFDVEVQPPKRIIQWHHRLGERGRLLNSQRLQYWNMNDPGSHSQLEQIGLSPRPAQTP